MVRQLESKITDKCIAYLEGLRERGYKIYYERRTGEGGFGYKKGIPDMWIVIDGVHIECELKTPWGERTPLQEKFALYFKKLGIEYFWPKSFSEFKKYIDKRLKIDSGETFWE